MKIIKIMCAGIIMLASVRSFAQGNKGWDYIGTDGIISTDTITKDGFTLIFINKSQGFQSTVKEKMISAFFKVYPQESRIYNPKTLKKVIFLIDPEYKGVAATSGSIVRYNPEWFERNPGDIDVVTHEVMHIVQSYPGNAGPGWITEGIADYVRYTLGVDNAGANWKLPEYHSTHKYTDAYRVTARFFVWMEKNYKGMVKKLDTAMRSNTYSDSIWEKQTGKTMDKLWEAYAGNPVI